MSHTHTQVLLIVKMLMFTSDLLFFISSRTDLRFLFSYHSNMRGKEGSRLTTRTRDWIVTGSLEISKAQPVVSNHYYCTVNSSN